MRRSDSAPLLAWTFLALLLILAWDASGLDLPLARLAGTPFGFPLREDWWLVQVLHEGGKSLSWALLAVLMLAIRWPFGFLRRLPLRERVQLAFSVLAGVLLVSLVKTSSTTSCPWDLKAFGGVAHYVSHWSWRVRDGGPGGCFPAGHASAAFAYLGGWFVLRRHAPRAARAWLICTLAAGLLLGLGQQLRGAHYMSHTLWTAWLCWSIGLVIDLGLHRRRGRGADSASGALVPNLNES
ncbi:phosphatase PAP2 family protein [Variovorax sp. KK3]|uniref:phosphatase PAP2 family protein n=1 Tax=Variovorax sp. KK3 TaxID=1855728 RepID=UPI00097C9289|nr:phosphatase PAP2 family protein [Variovorax sp. KK3]